MGFRELGVCFVIQDFAVLGGFQCPEIYGCPLQKSWRVLNLATDMLRMKNAKNLLGLPGHEHGLLTCPYR